MGGKEIVRMLLVGVAALTAGMVVSPNTVETSTVLIQESPLDRFEYHHGPRLWPQLQSGAALTLRREADHPNDARAVAVYWRDFKLGYVPQNENAVLAQLLDRGAALQAQISSLEDVHNQRHKLHFIVRLEVSRKFCNEKDHISELCVE